MNWRAIGCGLTAAVVFVTLGIIALNLALTQTGCPGRLQDGPTGYRAEGPATTTAQIPVVAETQPGGAETEPVEIGTTLIGIDSRTVYALPDEAPPPGSDELPPRLALDCADGTFQGYVREDP